MNAQFKNVAKTIAAAFVVKQVTNFAKASLAAAEAASTSRARIEQVAKSMDLFGNEVGQVTDRLVEYARQTALQTGIDKNQIQLTQAKLLTFKNLAATADEVGGAFDRATKAAIDMGAAGFGDAASNAVQLGKALQDPIRGITALNRSGITFTADQKELIKSLVETNRVGEAQALILEAIEQQVGGTAVATANASDKMRVAYVELQEQVGNALLPAFQGLTDTLIPLIGAFNALPASIKNVISTVTISTVLTAGLGRTLRGLGVSAGVARGAMGLLNLALIAYTLNAQKNAAQAARAAKAFDDLTRATDENAKAALIAAVSADVFSGSFEGFDGVLRKVAETSPGLAKRLVELGVAQEVLGISTDEANAIIDEQIAGLRQASKDADATADAIEDTGDAAGQAADEMRTYVKSLGFVVDESGNVEASQENMAKAVEVAQKRFDDAVQAVNDYEDALSDAFDAARRSIDTGFALVKSQEDAAEAVAAYEKAVKKGSISQEELDRLARNTALTLLDVADKAVANTETLAKMNGEQITTAERSQLMIDKLTAFRDTLDPSSPLAQYINGFIQTLGGIPTDILIELTTEVENAQRELSLFEQTAKDMGFQIGNQITKGILQALAPLSPEFSKLLREMQFLEGQAKRLRDLSVLPTVKDPKTLSDISPFLSFADGGIFHSPQVGLFAEAGAEAIIPLTRPARALELMRDSGLLGLAQQATGGQNFDITVVSAEPMRTAKDVVREFQALEYRMAPL
jgi:tetratricopeptide (TPR) repeat protein